MEHKFHDESLLERGEWWNETLRVIPSGKKKCLFDILKQRLKSESFCTELWVTSRIPHNQHNSNSFDDGEGHKKSLLTCKVLNFIKQSFQIFLKLFGAF